MDFEHLRVERTDGVGRIVLDDVDRRNAFDLTSTDELVAAVTDLGTDDDVRCIVLTHEGPYFGTGADLTQLAGDASDAPTIRRVAGRLHEAIVQLHRCETPVVGAVDGVAAGAGFSLALSPDILVVSEETRLEYAYPRIGLPGDGGATFFLPRLIGLRRAKALLLRDEPITPERAVAIGLANEVVASEEVAEYVSDLATEIAAGPTAAYGAGLSLLTASHERSLAEQLAAETDAMAAGVHSTDYERGYEAFFEGEDPEFVGE